MQSYQCDHLHLSTGVFRCLTCNTLFRNHLAYTLFPPSSKSRSPHSSHTLMHSLSSTPTAISTTWSKRVFGSKSLGCSTAKDSTSNGLHKVATSRQTRVSA